MEVGESVGECCHSTFRCDISTVASRVILAGRRVCNGRSCCIGMNDCSRRWSRSSGWHRWESALSGGENFITVALHETCVWFTGGVVKMHQKKLAILDMSCEFLWIMVSIITVFSNE